MDDIAKLDRRIMLLMLVTGTLASALVLEYSTAEDMGLFLSEAAMVSSGHKLYVDFFELKDPLFLWLIGLEYHFFGRMGPYIGDGLAVAVAPLVAFKAARSLDIKSWYAGMSGVVFLLCLTNQYFNSLRSGTLAIVLIVYSVHLAASAKPFCLGLISGVILGLKMPYFPIVICGLFLVYFRNRYTHVLSRFFLGFVTTLTVLLLTLKMRGELSGYFRMVSFNFSYRANYQELSGLKTGLAGRIQVMDTNQANVFVILMAVLLVTIGLFPKRRFKTHQPLNQVFCLLLIFSVLFILLTSAMWFHHLQPLAILSWAVMVLVFSNNWFERRNSPLKNLLLILGMTVALQYTHSDIPLAFRTPLNEVLSPDFKEPDVLKTMATWPTINGPYTFSRLGPNDEQGLVGFMDSKWRLKCRLYGQAGMESIDDINKFVACLEREPNYIFESPGYRAIGDRGNQKTLRQLTDSLLQDKFSCVESEFREAERVCVRRPSSEFG